MKALLMLVAILSVVSYADCVYDAKKKGILFIDSHTLLLQGTYGHDILIKTHAFLTKYSKVMILKDSFCSYTSNVLLVDGDPEDVEQVTKIDK